MIRYRPAHITVPDLSRLSPQALHEVAEMRSARRKIEQQLNARKQTIQAQPADSPHLIFRATRVQIIHLLISAAMLVLIVIDIATGLAGAAK